MKTEIILKEGYPYIIVSGIAFLISLILSFPVLVQLGLFLLFAFFVYFFRNPERIPEEVSENVVISPSDGTIVSINDAISPITKKEAIKVSIKLSFFDVHIQRSPIDGEMSAREYIHGEFLYLSDEKASELNEQNRTLFKNEKCEIVVNQIAGFITRRIVIFRDLGAIKLGDRYGMIMFGSQVDVYLPKSTILKVSEFQKVYAGESILGYINEKY